MKHWVPAPGNYTPLISGAILGVSIDPGETVQWAYTILPDGRRIATGYDIVTTMPAGIRKRQKKRIPRHTKNSRNSSS
jgi:hypothetical protein